ncbi:endoplasmic reticulum metallopeptidase 1-like [Bicyclus anynana]|uniref:Endoplasmic reticulum metallopeptidase 1-like n=1 Tax=Bicyclus anynana TaxID=110368 RepID=A0ABM3LQ41_BICAN|nr:endoplasmic reticulum metallopeptidase 1-like [Bicyclus anynana]
MKPKTEDDPTPRRNVPSPFFVLLLGFFMLVAFVTTAIEDELPRPIGEQEIGVNDSNTFSEESAKKYLQIILGDKPRVFGLEYHYIKTRDLKNLFDSIAAKSNIPIHTDWQLVDGYFWLSIGSPSVYRNLSNVIAVLEGESGFYPNGTIGTSILVNCHHDSVPFAIGASDDGLFCAAMVETLEKLSRRTTKLKHNIIFISNGAEEMGLQVTDARVLEAFRRSTSRPMAQSLGEFLFTNRIIPSDTDFRIWRDFGDIMGIDLAFVQWGHIYHTRNDRIELIRDGVMQNAGNMLLPLVQTLADYEGLVNRVPRSTAVYFDYMGWFLITFTRSAALAVDILVVLLGFTSVAYPIFIFGISTQTTLSFIRELLWSLVGRFLSIVSGAVVITVFASIMIATTIQMRYPTISNFLFIDKTGLINADYSSNGGHTFHHNGVYAGSMLHTNVLQRQISDRNSSVLDVCRQYDLYDGGSIL